MAEKMIVQIDGGSDRLMQTVGKEVSNTPQFHFDINASSA
jgi:hypothetical protein